jgi:hypothetical protein
MRKPCVEELSRVLYPNEPIEFSHALAVEELCKGCSLSRIDTTSPCSPVHSTEQGPFEIRSLNPQSRGGSGKYHDRVRSAELEKNRQESDEALDQKWQARRFWR